MEQEKIVWTPAPNEPEVKLLDAEGNPVVRMVTLM